MSYYEEKQKANLLINNMVDKARETRKELNINQIVYVVTSQFKVGELSVIKRLKLLQSVNKDFEIEGDYVVFK